MEVAVWTRINGVLLFWAALILTRPLGAVVGDLPRPRGLAFSRPHASGLLAVVILALILLLPQIPGDRPSSGSPANP
nr:hypothetical protein [Brevundimonas sp. Leaf168]